MPLPADLTTITVTGHYTDPSGAAVTGSVWWQVPVEICDATGKTVISTVPFKVSLSNGAFSIVLPCTDNAGVTPTDWTYTYTENLGGYGSARTYQIALPSTLGSTVDISQLLPISPLPPPPTPNLYGLLGGNNIWGGVNTFGDAVHITGTAPALSLTSGAQAGYVLTSDASGNATWQVAAGAGVYNVLSYGADPTGTADSKTAFNAAANAAATAGGGHVVIPSGSYKLTGPMELGPNTTVTAYGAYIVTGQSGAALLSNYWQQTAPTVYNGNGNITVCGGIWDGKGDVYTTGTSNTVFFGHARDITCRDMIIRNVQGYHGIEYNAIQGGGVFNCRIEGRQVPGTLVDPGEAIQIDLPLANATGLPADDNTPCVDITVDGCYAGPSYNPTTGAQILPAHGWLVGQHSDYTNTYYNQIIITNCTAVGTTNGGIHAVASAKSVINNNVITGCGGPGILLDPYQNGFAPSDVSIVGNQIDSCLNYGIFVTGYSSGMYSSVTIAGNTISNTQAPTGSIYAQYANALTIVGNTIDANAGPGVDCHTCTDVLVSSNTIRNGSYGVDLVTVTGFNVGGNLIDTMANDGVLVFAGGSGSISNNLVRNAAGAGIHSTGGSIANVDVLDNTVIQGGSGTQGIVVASGSSGFVVVGNDVSNATWTSANALSLVAGTVVTQTGRTGSRGNNLLPNATIGPELVVLGANVGSLTATSYTAITGLSCAIAPGTYKVTAMVPFTSSSTTVTAYGFSINGPTETVLAYTISPQIPAGTAVYESAYNNPPTPAFPALASGTGVARIDGVLTVTTAGTLQVTYQAAGSGHALTVLAGATLQTIPVL